LQEERGLEFQVEMIQVSYYCCVFVLNTKTVLILSGLSVHTVHILGGYFQIPRDYELNHST